MDETSDDVDMESGYVSPVENLQTRHQQEPFNFIMPPPKNDVRVKFEFKGERRIIPVARPVRLEELNRRVKTAYGQALTMNYINNEITIPIMSQSDLDKAIEILDRSAHLTSLRIFLSQPNGVVEKYLSSTYQNMTAMNSSTTNPKIGSLFGSRSRYKVYRARPSSVVRSKSTPDDIATMALDSPSTPSLSRYQQVQYMSTNDIAVMGRDSPPPGFHPEPDYFRIPRYTSASHYHLIKSEGEFIPETHDQEVRRKLPMSRVTRFGNPTYDPLSHSKVRVASSSDGSLTGSSSSLNGTFSVGSAGDAYSFAISSRRSSNNSFVFYPGIFSSEEDITENKADTFPRRRHTFSFSKSEYSLDGHQTFPRMFARKPIPPSMRSDQISPASSSSSSSGLMADMEVTAPQPRRPRRESELELALQKLKDVSTDGLTVPEVPRNWRKGKLLGAGAFGQVYICHDLDTGRELAVKQVEIGHINSATQKEVKALEAEIELLKNIQHERIVMYYGTELSETYVSIFMEYMPGISVHDHLKQHGRLNESLTKKYTRQVLEGVSYLHSNLIVHRDIKGANILRDLHGNVKLADFGQSKRLQTIRSKTGFRSVHGTPYWMAPEVIIGEGYGRKADIWSVGCTVVEMLTTKPPWSDFEPMAALFKIATQPTEPRLPSDISLEGREFVQAALTMNSMSRKSADEMLMLDFVLNCPMSTCL